LNDGSRFNPNPIITDLEGKIEYVNPKFCEISGYSYDDLIGRNPKILKSGYTPKEVYKDLWQTITAGKEWVGEFLNVKKNKELYWERASFSAIRDEYGSITNFLSVKEDISEHKQFEKQLMEAKNKAEESDRMKSTFLANMSHELRTPLNAVIGFSNLCDADMDKDQILDFVSLINKSGNQLLGIIEDILSFTAIEGEGLELNEEEFLMSYFLEELREKSIEKQALKNKGRLELRFVPDSNYSNVLVKADFAKLSHGILNLINNGLKFTHEGFVEVGYFIRGEQVNIYIEDSGVGSEKEKKDIIFESFRQSDDSITRTFGGTGLGLSITKKIIDKMGGKIEVESEPQKGTRFTVSLDCIISKEENMEIQNSNDNPVILVAEDELSNFRLIDAILKRHNYTVLRAEDGEEAIEMCKKNKSIVLVLMDIRMPGTNGLEATKSIKSQLPNLPVIAQTAYAMDGDKDKALAAGCDDYLSKPIRKDLLLSKLVQYINL
jgi:PAS domain S-box-containing protein